MLPRGESNFPGLQTDYGDGAIGLQLPITISQFPCLRTQFPNPIRSFL